MGKGWSSMKRDCQTMMRCKLTMITFWIG
jgi:hypothetical protein